MNEDKNDNQIIVKPYTQKELAAIYGVSAKTFRKWIRVMDIELGNRIGYYYSIEQVKIVFTRLQLPTTVTIVKENEYELYNRHPLKE